MTGNTLFPIERTLASDIYKAFSHEHFYLVSFLSVVWTTRGNVVNCKIAISISFAVLISNMFPCSLSLSLLQIISDSFRSIEYLFPLIPLSSCVWTQLYLLFMFLNVKNTHIFISDTERMPSFTYYLKFEDINGYSISVQYSNGNENGKCYMHSSVQLASFMCLISLPSCLKFCIHIYIRFGASTARPFTYPYVWHGNICI